MTHEEFEALGIPLENGSELDILYIESALQWILDNTTLAFDINNIEELKTLPSGAKLFVLKYRELMGQPVGVTSESIDGLSQSFSDTLKRAKLLDYARELLGGYMKSDVQIVPAVQKWQSKCQ